MNERVLAMPWWKSTIIWGAIISIVGKALAAAGVIGDIAPEDQERLADHIVLLASGIGDIMVMLARFRQRQAPRLTSGHEHREQTFRSHWLAGIVAVGVALLLAGCATVPPGTPTVDEAALIALELQAAPEEDRVELLAVVAAEVGARLRCPRNAVELGVLRAARLGFDVTLRAQLAPTSITLVDALRLRTDTVCGLIAAPA